MMHKYQFIILKILLLLCITSTFASHSNKAIITSVPFQDIALNPNDSVTANYSFGNHAIIFCFENNLRTIGNIEWSYKGNLKNHTLPISLKIRDMFEGEFADADGIVKITNTSNQSFIVSCQFGF